MTGAADAGGVGNVDGGANAGGAANVGGVAGGGMATPDAAGSATIGAGTGVSGVSSSTSVDTSGTPSVGDAPGDVTRQASDAQFQAGPTSGEAGIVREVGPDGKAIAKGGAVGVTERNLPGESDVDAGGRQVKGAQLDQQFEARAATSASVDGAVETTGYKDPVSEVGRAEQLEFNQRDSAVARADVATEPVDEARRTAANPSGAASAQVGTRTGVDANATRSDADEVASTVRNPEGAAESRAQARIDDEKRDAAASAKVDVNVSSSGSASTSSTTTKPGDKK